MVLLMGLGALIAAAYAGNRTTGAGLAVASPEERIDDTRTLDLADVVHIMPGTARSRGGAAAKGGRPVMRVEDGQLVLDFGAVPVGSDILVEDVLRIANEWNHPALVEVQPSPEAAAFIEATSVAGSASRLLAPGETAQVAVRLHVDASREPGQYHGTVLVRALGGFAHASLPALVRVLPPASSSTSSIPADGPAPAPPTR